MENATWLKNLRANPEDVSVMYGFRKFIPRVEIVSDRDQNITIVKWYVASFSKAAKLLFGWDSKLDSFETTNFLKLADLITMVLLHKD